MAVYNFCHKKLSLCCKTDTLCLCGAVVTFLLSLRLFAPLRYATRCRLTKKSQLLLNFSGSTVLARSSFLLYFVLFVSEASGKNPWLSPLRQFVQFRLKFILVVGCVLLRCVVLSLAYAVMKPNTWLRKTQKEITSGTTQSLQRTTHSPIPSLAFWDEPTSRRAGGEPKRT